jgi:hypothetical protein
VSRIQVADRVDRIFDEVDRQLVKVREQCTALAARAGLLLSATAIAAAVFVTDLDRVDGGEYLAFS